MNPDQKKLSRRADSLKDSMVETLKGYCRIEAISPVAGGKGELQKALWLERHLRELGFTNIERHDSRDPAAEGGVRPNIVVRVPGRDKSRTVWVVTHTDVVPAGDLSKWTIDPFSPVVRGDRVVGRGAEDNGHSLVASLYGLKALLDEGFAPKYNAALAFVADEENGSVYGIEHLLNKGLFKKNDILVVPDVGTPEGNRIEIAEKSIMWLKFRAVGKQVHGSTPEKGINAHKAAMKLALEIDRRLYKKFSRRDPLFSPPFSTFEPTKKDANVPNINTIPGEDVFFMDCRVLPNYKISDVLAQIRAAMSKVSKETKAKFTFEIVNGGKGTPVTPRTCDAYRSLEMAIFDMRGVRAKPLGVGGGTCAAIFRQGGYPAVVWSTIDENAHSPDEYTRIPYLVADAKVYAALFLGQ